MVSNKLYKTQKKVVVAYLQEIRKTTQNLSDDSDIRSRPLPHVGQKIQLRDEDRRLSLPFLCVEIPNPIPPPSVCQKEQTLLTKQHNTFYFYGILMISAVRFAQWCR
jgi:hypothetical protein